MSSCLFLSLLKYRTIIIGIILLMSELQSQRTKSISSFRRTKPKQLLRETQLTVLAPIYDKVTLLRQHIERKHPPPSILNSQILTRNKTSDCFLELAVDRNQNIQNLRKLHASQQIYSSRKKSQNHKSKTAETCQVHRRSRTQSLINFLHNNKSVTPPQHKDVKEQIKKQTGFVPTEDDFHPMGQQYLKQKIHQESIRSETFSITSRPESSIRVSKVGTTGSAEHGRKYLRKGARVRQLLSKQLQSPEERKSTPGSMTYLKDYDQWVPTTLVEEKKAELEAFMSVIYGDKRAQINQEVDLDKMQLVYL